MYFSTKSYLKSNRNHTAKHIFSLDLGDSSREGKGKHKMRVNEGWDF